jgi:ribosomal protein S18 acetylase RimI-like enzyme
MTPKTANIIIPLIKAHKSAVMDILRTTSEFKTIEVDTAEELMDYYLKEGLSSGYYHLVAIADSEVTGYICYGPTPLTESTWDVYWMAVTPRKKGQGIGTSLLETAEKAIKKQQGRILLIETSDIASYEPTRKFYQYMGYEEISRIPDFYSPGDGLVVFHKRLDGV